MGTVYRATQFGELPPTSAYRTRAEVSQAARGLAGERIGQAQRALRPDPARAYLLAQSVRFMQGVAADQLSQASGIQRQAERRAGAVHEGRVVSGNVGVPSCTIAIRSVRSGNFNCRFQIRCDRLIYGANNSGFNRCTRSHGELVGARDTGQTREDGDPEMTFDLARRRATVRDRGLDVTMEIVVPGAG